MDNWETHKPLELPSLKRSLRQGREAEVPALRACHTTGTGVRLQTREHDDTILERSTVGEFRIWPYPLSLPILLTLPPRVFLKCE